MEQFKTIYDACSKLETGQDTKYTDGSKTVEISDGDPNPNGSKRFEGSYQTVRIRIRIRKDPNANFIL